MGQTESAININDVFSTWTPPKYKTENALQKDFGKLLTKTTMRQK